MKPAIVFVAAFLVSTGASAGAKFAMTPAPLPPKITADSLKTANDSTHKDTTDLGGGQPPGGETPSELPHADSAKRVTAPATTAATASSPIATAPVATAPTAPAIKPPVRQVALEQAVARAIASETAPKDSATEGAERRVSKIFTAMDPKQAARVLEHMTDDDIHVILGYVGPRQAAAILAELKPERVAALSKLAMKPAKP